MGVRPCSVRGPLRNGGALVVQDPATPSSTVPIDNCGARRPSTCVTYVRSTMPGPTVLPLVSLTLMLGSSGSVSATNAAIISPRVHRCPDLPISSKSGSSSSSSWSAELRTSRVSRATSRSMTTATSSSTTSRLSHEARCGRTAGRSRGGTPGRRRGPSDNRAKCKQDRMFRSSSERVASEVCRVKLTWLSTCRLTRRVAPLLRLPLCGPGRGHPPPAKREPLITAAAIALRVLLGSGRHRQQGAQP